MNVCPYCEMPLNDYVIIDEMVPGDDMDTLIYKCPYCDGVINVTIEIKTLTQT